MDTKQEHLATSDTEWWDYVQTFDFGIGVGKLNLDDNCVDEADARFAEVSEETVRSMAKKKNAARTNESTKSGLKREGERII